MRRSLPGAVTVAAIAALLAIATGCGGGEKRAATPAWHRAIPDDHALILSGGNHGVELLRDRHRRRVRSAILAFRHSL